MKKIWIVLMFVFIINIVIAANPTFDEGLPSDGVILYEDTLVYYDINASDAEDGDETTGNLTYTDDTTLFDINETTGIISFTPDNDSVGVYNATYNNSVALIVKDSSDDAAIDIWTFEIVEVNDAPNITTLSLEDATENTSYSATIEATDEEGHTPFGFEANETFVNLTNLTSTTGQILFTPDNTQVGTWYINITVTDANGSDAKSGSRILTLNILNLNTPPTLDYVCNNERNATEDEAFTCEINQTDDDIGETFTYTSNESWFTINSSGWVDFTPRDSQVGNWTINVTVEDSGGLQDSREIDFWVLNISDTPVLDPIGAQMLYAGLAYYYDVNATDNDSLTPDGDPIYFSVNDTSLFLINSSSGIIDFTPDQDDIGELWLNISVNDSIGLVDSEQVNFTVINNTAPFSNLTDGNFSATEDIEFYYDFSQNITDLESNNLTFTDNTSLFDIGLTNGTISFTATDYFVGDNWVNLTVTDEPGATYSVELNFSVQNVEDSPVLTTIGNHTINEDDQFYYDVNATDEDLNIPNSPEVLTFSVNDTSLFNISSTTGIIDFVPDYDVVGDYQFNISVNDSSGTIAEEIINITINDINDAPVIFGIANLSGTQGQEFYHDFNSSDEEDNPTGTEDGTLVYADNTSWFDIDPINGTIVWTPNSSQVGQFWFNITVNDTTGLQNSSEVNITIYDINDAPVINEVVSIPFGGEGSVEENDSLTMTVYVDDADGDDLTYSWTVDGILNQTASDTGAGTQSDSFVYAPNFTEEGEHNITITVDDSRATDAYSWNITVNHTNAPPIFTGEIDNKSASGAETASVTVELSDYFSDHDYDDVNYNQSINLSAHQYNASYDNLTSPTFTVSINNDTWTATISTTSASFEIIEFLAYDGSYYAESNNFSVNLSISEPTAVVTTTAGGGGGGGGGGGRTYIAIDIIHPGDVSLFLGEQIITPLVIKNTGTTTLRDIGIEASTDSEDIDLILSNDYIPLLSKDQEETVDLTIITSNETKEGKREIIVKTPVQSPKVTDSVKLFVNLVEFGLEDKKLVKEKIVYLKDLLNENPECLELQEIVDQAEELMNAGEFSQAIEMSSRAIQACKDIVASVSAKKIETPLVRIVGDNIYVIIGEVLILIIVIWLIYRYIKRRKRMKMLK